MDPDPHIIRQCENLESVIKESFDRFDKKDTVDSKLPYFMSFMDPDLKRMPTYGLCNGSTGVAYGLLKNYVS
jgi:hypothetical protein